MTRDELMQDPHYVALVKTLDGPPYPGRLDHARQILIHDWPTALPFADPGGAPVIEPTKQRPWWRFWR